MRTTVLFSCLLMIAACHKNPKKRPGEISLIELATGGCFGPCQLTAIKLDSALNCQFYGGWAPSSNEEKILKGYYSGKLTIEMWDSITTRLQEIKFKKLPHQLQYATDAQTFEVIIHYGDSVSHMSGSFFNLDKSVIRVFWEIAHTYKKVPLKMLRQPIKFETTEQQRRRFRMSDSVGLSKKRKTFLCEYNVNGQKINGNTIQSIFAEKNFTINDFGVVDTAGYQWHFVLIFKPSLNNNTLRRYNSDWEMDLGPFGMAPENNHTFEGVATDVDPPDKLSITCVKNLNRNFVEDNLMLMKDVKNNNKKKKAPTKEVFEFYKAK